MMRDKPGEWNGAPSELVCARFRYISWSGEGFGDGLCSEIGDSEALERTQLEELSAGPITAKQAQYQPVPGISGLLGSGEKQAGVGSGVSGEGARPLASVPGANLSQPRAVGVPTRKFANYQAPMGNHGVPMVSVAGSNQ